MAKHDQLHFFFGHVIIVVVRCYEDVRASIIAAVEFAHNRPFVPNSIPRNGAEPNGGFEPADVLPAQFP